MHSLSRHIATLFLVAGLYACAGRDQGPSEEQIRQLHLKTGQVISCGPPEKEFGTVVFEMSCNEKVRDDFNNAMELLHSFEYDEAEKVFAKVINASRDCAMAYWGVAMCNFHPLWEPPAEAELVKGSEAIEIATAIENKSDRESAYITAAAAYYRDWNRTLNFEKAMEQLYRTYPNDPEAAIFYSLALDASADPSDKSYRNQKKAGSILETLYKNEPNHPGIIHYIIHTYDYPGLAELGLAAARRYATVAPSSAHALHMPSHIFTRLGYWDESIKSNSQSMTAAKCYAASSGIKGHWDEELHGLDYLVYAYLQKGNNKEAKEQLAYLGTINMVYPVNFKVAYTLAAVPARIALENGHWDEAAGLTLHAAGFAWNRFPWQQAMIHFARLLGAAHKYDLPAARSELDTLSMLHDSLAKQKDAYKANQVAIQVRAGEAWMDFFGGNKKKALALMETAADMEDSTSKHPVTPGEVLPARELYADMLLQVGQNESALQAYEKVLEKSPNRFNSLYGTGLAAERSGRIEKARDYYRQLLAMADPGSGRPELTRARLFLQKHP